MVLISCTGKNSKKLFYTQLLLFTYGFTDLTDLLTSSFSIFFFSWTKIFNPFSHCLFIAFSNFCGRNRTASMCGQSMCLCKCIMASTILFSVHFYQVVYLLDSYECQGDVFMGQSLILQGFHSWVALISKESVSLHVEMELSFSLCIALHLCRWKFTCHLIAQVIPLGKSSCSPPLPVLTFSVIWPDAFSTSLIQIHLQGWILLAPELFSVSLQRSD